MSTAPEGPRVISERTALILLVVFSALLAFAVIWPYLPAVMLAGLLAYVLYPLQRRLERFLSPMQAALLLTVASVLAVFVPLAYVTWRAIEEGRALVETFAEGGLDVRSVERELAAYGLEVDLQEFYDTYRGPITNTAESIAFETLDVVRSLPGLFISLTVLLFVLFALLRDGRAVVAWTRAVVPLREDHKAEFFEEVDRLMWASVVGNVAVAAIQAGLLGVGLLVLGFQNVIFFTVATFVLALLPLVGAFVVWLPLSLLLFVLGDPVFAAVLFVYGSLVSVSDFYLRPWVIGQSGALNSAIVVLGIFGGLVVFGAIGLFVGPVVLGGAKLALDMFARERTRVA